MAERETKFGFGGGFLTWMGAERWWRTGSGNPFLGFVFVFGFVFIAIAAGGRLIMNCSHAETSFSFSFVFLAFYARSRSLSLSLCSSRSPTQRNAILTFSVGKINETRRKFSLATLRLFLLLATAAYFFFYLIILHRFVGFCHIPISKHTATPKC